MPAASFACKLPFFKKKIFIQCQFLTSLQPWILSLVCLLSPCLCGTNWSIPILRVGVTQDYESAGHIIRELFPLRLSKEVSGNVHQVFELHMTPDDAASHLFSNLYTYSKSGTGVFWQTACHNKTRHRPAFGGDTLYCMKKLCNSTSKKKQQGERKSRSCL